MLIITGAVGQMSHGAGTGDGTRGSWCDVAWMVMQASAHTHAPGWRGDVRLLRTAWIRTGHIHVAGSELHSSRVTLLRWRIGVRMGGSSARPNLPRT